MSRINKNIHSPGVRWKAAAVLNAIRDGHRTVEGLSGASGLPPTTILRVAGLLRDLDLVGRLPGSDPLELLPVFQQSGADD